MALLVEGYIHRIFKKYWASLKVLYILNFALIPLY